MKINMLLLLILLSTVTTALCRMDFTGHRLLALLPSNMDELEFLRNLAEDTEMDIWNFPTAINEKVNVRVSPAAVERLQGELECKGIDFYVVTDNIQEWIDEEREENPPENALTAMQDDFQLDVWHTFDTISSYLDSVSERYEGLTELQVLGTTREGNPIKGLKIGSPKGDNKSAIWIDSCMHAREWVACATTLYFIEQLVKGYDTDPEIRKMVDTFDWYIFPVMNPDGYIYTWTDNRMWRKNRSPFSGDLNCHGIDPNRNFDADFGGAGTSNKPCSESYGGTSPFSEAESQAVRDGVLRIGSNMKGYITIHSYSQLWMTPYGFKRDNPSDYDDHMKVLSAAVRAIKNVHGQTYKYGTIAKTIYPTAGSSTDWAYTGAKIKYSFAAELRDTGRHGFMLSNSQIIPTAEENFAAIKTIANHIQAELSKS